MKTAEQLAHEIDYMTNRVDLDLDIPKAAALIRARDKEIVEACKAKAIDWCQNAVTEVGCMAPKEEHWIDLSTYLDSVLRDLE